MFRAPSWSKGVSPDEEYDGETNGQDDAWYARHASFLSGAVLRKNGTFGFMRRVELQNVNKMPAAPRVKKNVLWNTRGHLDDFTGACTYQMISESCALTLCAALHWRSRGRAAGGNNGREKRADSSCAAGSIPSPHYDLHLTLFAKANRTGRNWFSHIRLVDGRRVNIA